MICSYLPSDPVCQYFPSQMQEQSSQQDGSQGAQYINQLYDQLCQVYNTTILPSTAIQSYANELDIKPQQITNILAKYFNNTSNFDLIQFTKFIRCIMAVQNNLDIDEFLVDTNKVYMIHKKSQAEQPPLQKVYSNICQVSLPHEYLFETQFSQITQLINDNIAQLDLIKQQDEKAPVLVSKENNTLIKGMLQQLGQTIQNACQNFEQKLQDDDGLKTGKNECDAMLEEIEKYSSQVDAYVKTLNKTLELERQLAMKTEALLRIRDENKCLESIVQNNDKTLDCINKLINDSDFGNQLDVAKQVFKDIEAELPQLSEQDNDDEFWNEIEEENSGQQNDEAEQVENNIAISNTEGRQ